MLQGLFVSCSKRRHSWAADAATVSNHGPTDLTNLVLLCGYHHRLIHHSEWQVRINPKDGLPEFLPPSYIDASQLPRRNGYHRRE